MNEIRSTSSKTITFQERSSQEDVKYKPKNILEEDGQQMYEHPFQNPRIQEIVRKHAPEFLDRLKDVTIPQKSDRPDDLENFEANRILTRKNFQLPNESDFAYLLRLVYEETFIVNPTPGDRKDMFKASLGFSPGGLISHCIPYHSLSVNGLFLADAPHVAFSGNSIREALLYEKDFKIKNFISEMVADITFPGNDHMSLHARQGLNRQLSMIGRKDASGNLLPSPVKFEDDANTVGYRLLSLLHCEPSLCQPIQDPALLEAFGFLPTTKHTKAQFIRHIWKKLGTYAPDSPGMVFNPYKTSETEYVGVFKQEDDPGATEALKLLLYLRTHPEMQVIYKYLSPSGYLNEAHSRSERPLA